MSITMPRPGSIVQWRSTAPARSVPTDTGVWFVAGLADKGPASKAVEVLGVQDFKNKFGDRQTYSVLYDAIEAYFREGGATAYISRVVGPGAIISTLNLVDAGAATSLIASAKGPGAYGDALEVAVQNPGIGGTPASFSLAITDTSVPGSPVVEQSPDFTDLNGAVAWATNLSRYINLALGASGNLPAAHAATALAGGTDDRASITDAQWKTALDAFTKDLGPGQVTQIGRTTSQAYIDTLDHAYRNNRVAILDLPDSPSVSVLTAAASALRTAIAPSDGAALDSFGGAFGPWVVVPGIIPNTTRTIPPSAIVCGLIALSDGQGNSPNVPAAADNGISNYAIGLSQPPYDDGRGQDVTRDAMYALGVNLLVYRYGVFEVFGWRTLVDPNGQRSDWLDLGNRRLAIAMTAQGFLIMSRYELKEIDGQGNLFARLKGALQGMCGDFYTLGSLYGEKPEDAYIVDTGRDVNTPATIANKEIHAAIAARMSQDGELVVLEIAKIPVNQNLPSTS